MTEHDPAAREQPPGRQEQPPGPRRLLRSRDDRMIAGVAGGLGRHFGIDPVIFRIGFAGAVFVGGVGILLYLAAVVLVPAEGGDGPSPQRNVTLVAVAALAAAAVLVVAGGPWFGPFWFDPFGLVWLLAFAAAAAVAWQLVEQRRGGDPPSGGAEVLRRLAGVLGMLTLLAVAAVAGAWGTAVGAGELVAGLVIALGGVLVVSSFYGGAPWLALPALALAVPAGLVAAAGVEVDGGVGEELHRPQTLAQVRGDYRLTAGRLELDLRDVDFPAGRTPLDAEVGVGQIDVLVPGDVCVVAASDVGIGAIDAFGRESGGIDVRRHDAPPRGHVPQLVLDADVGVGQVRVAEHPDELDRHDSDGGAGRTGDPCAEAGA